VPDEIPAWLQPGQTTLADVFFRLGEPDDVSLDERTLGWVNVNRLGGGVLLFFNAGAGAMVEHFRRLVVQFDENEVVTERWMESATCTSGIVGVASASQEWGGGCLPPFPGAGP
jgi:hypothetical protein